MKHFIAFAVIIFLLYGCNITRPPAEDKQKTGETQRYFRKTTPQTRDITPEEIKGRLKSPDGVKKIQTALRKAGFDPGPIDGKMGPKTKKALRGFQKASGLVVDGSVNVKTWKALSGYFAEKGL